MMPSTWTAAQAADYAATLRGSYQMSAHIQVLNNSRKVLSTLPGVVVDGQIDVRKAKLDPTEPKITYGKKDDDQRVNASRVAKNLRIFDPERAITFDSNAPTDGAIYLDRMIRIIVRLRSRLYIHDVTVFVGPVDDLERTGSFVELEASGMEAFGMGASFLTGTLSGGADEVFRILMGRTGETAYYMHVPNMVGVMPSGGMNLQRDTRLWDKAFGLAASKSRHAYYNSEGHCWVIAEPSASSPQAVFDSGDTGLLLSEPKFAHSIDDVRNAYWVKTTTSTNKPAEGTAVLPVTHPLNHGKIGRNSKGRYLLGTENNPDLKTAAKAKSRATTLLNLAQATLSDSFESRPVFHLEAIGYGLVRTAELSTLFPLEHFSLPLTPGRPMVVGGTKRIPAANLARWKKVRG